MISPSFISVAKRILRSAAELGIEEAGLRICGSGWQPLKKVLTPVFKELERRYPKMLLVPEEMQKAEADLANDPNIAALLQEKLAALQEGQFEILRVLLRHDQTLQSYRQLILGAFKEADTKNQARHERVIAEFAQVKGAIARLPEQIAGGIVQPHLSLDEIYKQANGYQMDAMKWISARDPQSASQRLASARSLARGGLAQYGESASLMVTLGFIEKSQAQASTLRNDLDGSIQNLALAAEYFARAIQIEPQNLDALNGMANVYYFGRDYDTAIQLGLAIVKADPTHGPALNDLCLAIEDKMKEVGPQPSLIRVLVPLYKMLEKLMPLQPQLFPAAYLAHVQKRLAELQKTRG